MILDEVPNSFREALAVHDIFMSFGLPAEDIFASYFFSTASKSGKFQVVAQQGNLEYRVDISDLLLDKEAFSKMWVSSVKAYNSASKEERFDLVESTKARQCAVMIIAGLAAKGFRSPDLRPVAQA